MESLLTTMALTDAVEKSNPRGINQYTRGGGGAGIPSSNFEHARAARQSSGRASFTNKPEHHATAARHNREASEAFRRSGNKELAAHHARIAERHQARANAGFSAQYPHLASHFRA